MKFLIAILLLWTIKASGDFKSECFGPEGPVKMIYLHGLFPPSGANWYIDLESNNRKYLKALAAEKKVRIAAPVASGISKGSYGTNRNWNGETLASILLKAQTCGSISKETLLVGFSNGGYRVRALKPFECRLFKHIYAIGSPGVSPQICPNRNAIDPHVFPPKGITWKL